MKTSKDPRHQKRVRIMQELFEWEFNNDTQFKTSDTEQVVENIKRIDQVISQSATERPIKDINRIDLAILRLAVFELIITKEAPEKVIVDEAVELGKEFGSESSPGFINGVLGKVVEENIEARV